MTSTVTLAGNGVAIGIFATIAAVCGLYAFWTSRKLRHESHGTVRLSLGMSGLLAGFLCVIAAGIASLIGQYG